MKTNKKCIFHIPNAIDVKRASASQIRPRKMKEAFENIGYEVDVVWGGAKERKKAVRKIKQNIKKGVKYDFMYSESSTTPTLLTESHHLPIHPFLDFDFFRFIKKQDIKIGLFYRDMYWKFPAYKEAVKGLKYEAAVLMYKYDLYKYNQLLTKLYQPNEWGKKYLTSDIRKELLDCLPPGCETHAILQAGKNKVYNNLNLLYIGGLGGHYRIHKIFEAVGKFENIQLTVCCREKEWHAVEAEYYPLLHTNIKIVHKKGKELEKLYERVDIGINFFELNEYMKMATPYKLFEYLSHGIPIIGTAGMAAGEFIASNEIGWSIEYDSDEVVSLLSCLLENPDELIRKAEICRKKIKDNTWEKRAEKVASDLH